MATKLTLKALSHQPERLAPGHRLCAGCAAPIVLRQILLAIDELVVLTNATGCLEVGTSIYPYTSWRVPWIHSAFENSAATGAGVEAAMQSLVRQGKIRYIGCSTHPTWAIMESFLISQQHHLNRYVVEESPYNLLDRRIENELIPMAQKYGMGIITWVPMAMGVLAGRYTDAKNYPKGSRAEYRGGKRQVLYERPLPLHWVRTNSGTAGRGNPGRTRHAAFGVETGRTGGENAVGRFGSDASCVATKYCGEVYGGSIGVTRVCPTEDGPGWRRSSSATGRPRSSSSTRDSPPRRRSPTCRAAGWAWTW